MSTDLSLIPPLFPSTPPTHHRQLRTRPPAHHHILYPPPVSLLSWLRFWLTLLEASVIPPPCLLPTMTTERTIMAQLRIQLSILVLFPSLPIASPPTLTSPVRIHSLEYTHHRTKYPILVSGVRLPLIPSYHHSPPSLLSSINCIFISSQVPCIFDYAPSHSHLIFTLSLLCCFLEFWIGPSGPLCS